MWNFLVAAKVVSQLVQAQALPTLTQALVAFSSSNVSVTLFDVPGLGDLHRKFTGLPESCEVLVGVRASSVNPADRFTPGPFPQVMGSDLAGVVLAVEDTCKRLKPGDRVWADIGAVTYSGAQKGKENGAYAQVAVALETQLGGMPSNLDFQEAASLPKVALTSYKALAWYGGAPYAGLNKTVLILGGSGGCGITAIQLAKAFSATQIITTTSAANKDFVQQLGADKVVDYHAVNWWDVLADGSVDVIYDTVGQAGTGDRAMKKLRSGGYYVAIAGAHPSQPRSDVHVKWFINSDTNLNNFHILDTLRNLVEEDKLRMQRLKSFKLSDVLTAFSESAEGHVNGKLVIDVPSLPISHDEFF
mmetsp:Transcript_76769/g.148293  ORF Transcript_76769/g.148293 Transcript_76769/m.148293 type:complete len:360 (-) Transcript_76769:254-1333(-)